MGASWKAVKSAIAGPGTKVVSFDVFDTLLVRPFWYPVDLFQFLDKEAEELEGTTDLINFSVFRREAETKAREEVCREGREDLTLKEIYGYIERTGVFHPETVRRMMEKELELELRFCRARKSALRLVRFAAEQGKRIVAISDMYLPSGFIGKLLKKNGFPEFERIFVSGETGYTKVSGRLYEHAAGELKTGYGSIIHIGDNLRSDVKVPEKLGIRAVPFYRAIDLMTGECGVTSGTAFKRAYKDVRSPFSNYKALEKLGTRCMLAAAANRVYDDPFRRGTGFAGDPELFGNLCLGLYCMAHAMWVKRISEEDGYDKVLFFARDGYLPFRGYEMIRQYCGGTEGSYVRMSRRSVVPLLLSDKKRMLTSGSHISYKAHSPKTMVHVMSPVLKKESRGLEKIFGKAWERKFDSELSMMRFIRLLREQYLDPRKAEEYQEGFLKYITPFAGKKILTYDVGYNLRNEAVIKSYFPKTDITACYTHSLEDMGEKRGRQGNIRIRSFYHTAPFVSWLPRELFLTEDAPSCIGYTKEGIPVLEKKEEQQILVKEMQAHALRYMKEFTETFREYVPWLPMDYADACLPMEAFLHSPDHFEREWVKDLEAENYIDSAVKEFKCCNFWRKLRTDYWIADHHLGKYGRHAVRFIMLTCTDRDELRTLIEKRIPGKIKRRLNTDQPVPEEAYGISNYTDLQQREDH